MGAQPSPEFEARLEPRLMTATACLQKDRLPPPPSNPFVLILTPISPMISQKTMVVALIASAFHVKYFSDGNYSSTRCHVHVFVLL